MATLRKILYLWSLPLACFITHAADVCNRQEVASWTCHPSNLARLRKIHLKEYGKIAHARPEIIHWQKVWLRSSDFGDWTGTDCRFYTFFPKNQSINLIVRLSGLYLYQTLSFKTCKSEPCAFLMNDVWEKCPIDISDHLTKSEYSIGLTTGFYSTDLQKKIKYVTLSPGKVPANLQFIFFDKHLLEPTGFIGLVLTSNPKLTNETYVIYPKNHTTGTLNHHPSFRMLDFVFDHSPFFFLWDWIKPFVIYAWDFFQDFNVIMPIFSAFFVLFSNAIGNPIISTALSLVVSIYIHQQGLITW